MTEPTPKSGMRRLLLGAAFAATFALGGVAASVLPAVAAAHGMGMHHEMGGDHAAMMTAHIDKMLTALDATPEQRAKINAILAPAFEQLKGVHGGMEQGHHQLLALITAPTIDRAALENLRAEHIAAADRASKVLAQALADAADVLTPAQRAKLGAMAAEHHHGG